MGAIVDIRGYNGKLQVKFFGCCDWVDVPGFTGSLVTSGDAPETDLPGSAFLDDISKLFPKLPYSIPAPSGHDTADSIRCAKATAMQDGLFVVLYEFRDLLDEIQLSNVTVAGILGYMAGVFLSGGWALAATIYTIIAGYANDQAIDDLRDEIQEDWSNTGLRTEMICLLTPKLTTGTEVTADDFRALVEVWYQVFAPSSNQKRVIQMLPASFTRKVMQELLPQTPCGCDAYKPFGYVDPVTAGALARYDSLAYAGTTFSNMTSVSGQPFELLPTSIQSGVRVSSTEFKTKYSGADSAGGFDNKYTSLGLVLKMNTPAELDEVKFDLLLNGAPSGGAQEYKLRMSVYTTEQGWVGQNGSEDGVLANVNNIIRVPNTNNKAHYLFIRLMTRNTNESLTATLKNIRMTGNIDGAGFLNIPLGQAVI